MTSLIPQHYPIVAWQCSFEVIKLPGTYYLQRFPKLITKQIMYKAYVYIGVFFFLCFQLGSFTFHQN